jgi:putative endonuclease
MLSGQFTQLILQGLDWLADRVLPPDPAPEHQRTGRRGEEDAYFYLRRSGYVIIARNYRSPHHRGELDFVGWHGDVLCFIEIKTRTTRDVKPAEAAVDHAKRQELAMVALELRRHIKHPCPWRFDIVAVYYDDRRQPTFELFQNAFPMSYNR